MEPKTKIETPAPLGEAEARSEFRSNIFVVASIAAADASGPVRIRNMSCRGGLIEGGALPPAGAPVRLSRGSVQVSGFIAWRDGNRAGVRFESSIAVADWLPHGPRTHQQRVDEVVDAFKRGVPGPEKAIAPAPTPPAEFRNELRELEQMLRQAAENLTQDVHVCERHLTSLQLLDSAVEKLAKLIPVAK